MQGKVHVGVVGAGAFGGWSALHLLRRGARVTLIDSWGAGNWRSSSGGETRIMRCTYGPAQPYTKMALRATELWQKNQQLWNRRLLHQVGVLWLVSGKDQRFEEDSLPVLREAGIEYEELTPQDVATRWPQINLAGVRWAMFEPGGGCLMARNACEAVLAAFLAEGGEFRQGAVLPDGLEDGRVEKLRISDGSALAADIYIFACGPWLGKLFPQTIGRLIQPTKQDVFFFGTPQGDDRFSCANLPVWGDHAERFVYGIPACDGRGFKVADDTRGPQFDPTTGERTVSAEALKNIRDYVGFRFPAMKDAPLLETRVCQYEDTPDSNFIIDRHPQAGNVLIVGGGSGHGFKHGPALGEIVADCVMQERAPDPVFRLARFKSILPS